MNATLFVPLALITVITATACSSSESAPDSTADAGGDLLDGGSGDTSTPDPTFEQVWKPSSQRLEISSFGYWDGSQGYDITRDRLSGEQLEILDGLREVPTPEGPLGADFPSYVVRITDRSGEVIEYRAAYENVRDIDEASVNGDRTIDYETLAPFLETFDCLSAKETVRPPDDASVADRWIGAATLTNDPSCINGVFVSYDDSHSYRKWQVDAAGTYRLTVTRCFQQMRLRLFEPKDQTELASSELATAPDCPTLVHQFDAPGTYLIDLEKTRDVSAEHDGAGDALVRVSQD